MKAIILAAGIGTRLGKYTKDLPKCMLNFNGRSLLEHQIDVLHDAGIDDIVIVRGYMPGKIQIPNVKYYENSHFADTNMVESLFVAEDEMEGDVLICYADIIYEQTVLEKLMKSKADIGVTVDNDYWDYWKARLNTPEEDVESLVIDSEGKIVELGDTKCTIDKAEMRYVGLIKFSKKGVDILKKIYHENREKYFDMDEPWLRSRSFKKAYMSCMLQAIINSGYRVEPIIVTHGWLEFDTVDDYERANDWLQSGEIAKYIQI